MSIKGECRKCTVAQSLTTMKVLHFLFVFLTVALCHTDGQIRELSHNDLRQVKHLANHMSIIYRL